MYETRRLLLLEFFTFERQRIEKSQFFPFLKGLAQAHGIQVLWLCFGVKASRRWNNTKGRTTFVDLSDEDLQTLRIHCDYFKPTHAVSGELLSEQTQKIILSMPDISGFMVMPLPQEYFFLKYYPQSSNQEMSPWVSLATPFSSDTQYFAKQAWFLKWLGIEGYSQPDNYMIENAMPDYSALPANQAAWQMTVPIAILSGLSCSGRPSVYNNPIFNDVDMSDCLLTTGCSFCGGSPPPPIQSPEADSLFLAENQFRRIMKTAGAGGRNKNFYDIYDLMLFKNIDALFSVIFRLGIPPGTFSFCPRIDDVLGVAGKIGKLLPRLAEARYCLYFSIMGLESFSQNQLLRYNKNITIEQVDELISLQEKWFKAYPEVFDVVRHGLSNSGWSMILFSPWTTFDDLRLNLKHAGQRGFDGSSPWLYSSLLIRNGTPIAALARKEGNILQDNYDDRALLYFQITTIADNVYGILPWRFKDTKVADYYSIIARICAAEIEGENCPFFENDQEFHEFRKIFLDIKKLDEESTARGEWITLKIARSLLDVIETAAVPYSRQKILEEAVSRLRNDSARSIPDVQTEQTVDEPLPKSAMAIAVENLLYSFQNAAVQKIPDIKFKSLTEKFDTAQQWTVYIELFMSDRDIILELKDLESDTPCFFQSRFFKVSYRQDTPVRTAEEKKKLHILMEMIDKCMDDVP
jgi:hypothetical protein